MKRIVLILLTVVICVSLCACGSSSNSESLSDTPSRPSRDRLEQAIVNKCCDYSNVSSVSIDYGTFDTEWSHSYDAWITTAKGTYFPVDAYGSLEDKMQFDITLEDTDVKEYRITKYRY